MAVPTLILYALAFVPFMLVGESLSRDMLRLQQAGSESKAREIVTSWSPGERVDMAFLQGVDELHPLLYGLLFALAAVWAGRQVGERMARWASGVAWLAILAAALDLVENVGMILMIRGDFSAPLPAMTTALSIGKASLLIAVVLYLLAGIVARVRRRVVSGPS